MFFHRDPLCKEAMQKTVTSKLNLTKRWAHTRPHNRCLEKQITFSFRKRKKRRHEKQITVETYWLNDSNIMTHSQSRWFKKPCKWLKMWKIIVLSVTRSEVTCGSTLAFVMGTLFPIRKRKYAVSSHWQTRQTFDGGLFLPLERSGGGGGLQPSDARTKLLDLVLWKSKL